MPNATGAHAPHRQPGVAGRIAQLSAGLGTGLLLLSPSVTSTLPVGRSVAVCSVRAGLILPAANQVLLAKSYSSALAWIGPLPPATSARPESSRVAVWEVLAAVL